MTAFGSVTGIRHRPAAALSRVPVTISPSRAHRPFGPGCLRPEPGQSAEVVSVSDDVMEPDRHAVRMPGRQQ